MDLDYDKKYAQDVREEYKTTTPEHERSYSDVAPRPRRTTEEKRADLVAAQLVDPGMEVFSWRAFKFVLMVLVVCLCGGDSGLDATTMSSINGMKQFQSYFGLGAAAAKTGIVFGMYTIGSVAAAVPASYFPDKVGRRWTMLGGNVVLIIGAILSATATGMGMFLAGRFLTGLGCVTAANAAKAYMAEITSPSTRGRAMGLLNSFYYVGQILASGLAVPLGRKAGNVAWRVPLWIQVGFPAINIACVLLLPESPRWLYARGHKERARQVLADLHSRDRDINSPLINFEIEEIEEALETASADKNWWDFRKIFARGHRYRISLAFMVSVYGQLSGNGLITYFLTILLAQAGIKDQNKILTLNFVNSVTSFVGALTGTAIVDKVGRRKLMLFACCCCCVGMFIVGGLLSPAGPQTIGRANAGISFIFLFMVFFSLGWTPLQGLYPSEVLSYENRAKGLALQSLATQAVSCINTFGLPSALAALTYKTYFIFGAFDFIGIFVIYFAAVETKQLALEQIDEVFTHSNPRAYSLELVKERRRQAREAKAGAA